MERDFLGMYLKESAPMAKEECKDGGNDSVFLESPKMQRPAFSNKVPALPQFTMLTATQEEKPKMLFYNSHVPSAFQRVPTPESCDTNHKPIVGLTQKNFNIGRRCSHFAVPTYVAQAAEPHSVSGVQAHELMALPVSNHPVSLAMRNPFFKIHRTNTAIVSAKQQPLGGIPVTAPHYVVPVAGGGCASKSNPKLSAGCGQLTIFYKGMVNVYDDISLDKVQAIMSLAQTANANPANLKPQVRVLVPPNPELCTGLPTSIAVASQSNVQSERVSGNHNDLMATSFSGVLAAHPSIQKDPASKFVASASETLMPAEVPQARKASLARFLEKRKERMLNAIPYAICNKSPESSQGSEAASLTMAISTGLSGTMSQS